MVFYAGYVSTRMEHCLVFDFVFAVIFNVHSSDARNGLLRIF